MYENQSGTGNAAYLRDPASAITQRKYALAQALQKQGMDTSPVVGTGNNTMQALARVLQGGLGAYMGQRVEGEAAEYSAKQRDDEAKRQALILGLTQDTPAGGAPPAAAPMPDRLGGAPMATDAERAALGAPGTAPVAPVQRDALPPIAGAAPTVMGPQTAGLQRQGESGGRLDAKNPLSTATGPDQFIDGTWRAYAAANPDRFKGMSDAQIMEMRKNSDESGNATQWLAGENRTALAAAGLPTGPGELTLAHRFGAMGAARALKTDPNTPAASVFGPEVMKANPDLAGKSVGQVVQQYQGRYGGTQTAGAPEPTAPGGAAARTGGTDMAGPGVPAAPEQPAGPTPADLRRRAAQAAALDPGRAGQQAAQMLNSRADALERQQFQTQNITETRRLAAEAAGERRIDRADTNRRQDEQQALARAAAARAEDEARLRRDTSETIPDPARPGAVTFRPGGARDPAVIAAQAAARGEGKPGRPIPGSERDKLLKEGGTRDSLVGLRDSFKNDFGGYKAGWVGETANTLERNTGGGPRSDWWQQYDRQKNIVRNELFGASLTSNEQAAFEKTDIHPGMSPETIRANLKKQSEIIDTALRRRAGSMKADNYSTEAIEQAGGFRFDEAPPSAAGGGGAPMKVASPEEAAKLPKGTPIMLPDGSIGRVP